MPQHPHKPVLHCAAIQAFNDVEDFQEDLENVVCEAMGENRLTIGRGESALQSGSQLERFNIEAFPLILLVVQND